MERFKLEHYKEQIRAATAEQTLELEDFIKFLISQRFSEMALARRTRLACDDRICPHCYGNNIVMHGKDQNGRQRFKCRDCNRTYNILTGTKMARARKPEKWVQYLDCMTEHMALRKIVASGIGVHLVTAWRWRHRFLQAAADDKAAVVSGVIEADTTFFQRSFKGSRNLDNFKPPDNHPDRLPGWRAASKVSSCHPVPVLTAMDSSDGVYQAILASLTEIETALTGRIAPCSVLCSDGNAAYVKLADTADAEHKIITVARINENTVRMNLADTPRRKPGRLGLGRVNSHHQRLKYLINEQCRGVATKHLSNYLGWHRALTRPGFKGRMLLAQALD